MEGNYSYRPLSRPGNIRTLLLQPAHNLTEPLLATLDESAVAEFPYTALSYSWAMEDDGLHPLGDSTAKEELLLEDCTVLIGENLRDALRRLRKVDQPIRLWVDAVCIDQKNEQEKSAQVSIMGSIYANAETVVAWLGEGDSYSNEAAFVGFQCLLLEDEHRAINNYPPLTDNTWFLKHCWLSGQKGWLTDGPPSTPCDSCKTYLQESAHLRHPNQTEISPVESYYKLYKLQMSALKSLRKINKRRYFSRVWVLQEVDLPQTPRVRFQLGSYTVQVNLLDLTQNIYTMERSVDGSVKITSREGYSPDDDGYGRSLVEWVEISSRNKCADPRDKLYGILALAHDVEMQPDYALSIAEVYGKFAKYLLEKGLIVSLLSHSCGRSRAVDDRGGMLSSWMSDLRNVFSPLYLEVETDGPWTYIQPRLSADYRMLFCWLCYVGTMGLRLDNPHERSSLFAVHWEKEEQHQTTTDESIVTFDISGHHWRERLPKSYYADISLSNEQHDHGGGDRSVAFATVDIDPYSCGDVGSGDILCLLWPRTDRAADENATIILRPTPRLHRWEVVGQWSSVSYNFKDSRHGSGHLSQFGFDRTRSPHERRRYALA